jgi:predicted small lipoprotein YifL
MKIANILLLSASIAALAACGKEQPDTANPGDVAAPVTEEPAAEEPAAEEPAEEEPAEEAAAEEPAAE